MITQRPGEDPSSVTWNLRVPAFLLIAGGALGVGACLGLAFPRALDHPSSVAILLVFLFLYGMSVWTGIDLWRGRPRGIRWGKFLFAAQIPLLSVSGFSYKFTTGLSAGLALIFHPGKIQLHLPFYIGSSFELNLGTAVPQALVGFNGVAVMAVILLMDAGKRKGTNPSVRT